MIKNYGVILGDAPDTYRAGRVGGALPFILRNESGNWDSDLPAEERQSNDNGDSMACVTFSELNGVETQEFHLNVTGEHPEYSDRWIAKMSGTTPQGNYLYKVADAIRKFGLVKEASYPKPSAPWTWEQYHSEISEPLLSQLKAEGQEWLKKWDVKYESVAVDKASLMRHLKMAPLTVVIPGHAILNFQTTADVIRYFDTYPPHKKYIESVLQAMKVVLYPRTEAIPDEHLLVDINYLDAGRQVEKLKNALNKLGWLLKPSEYPAYDLKLAEVVLNFQKATLSHFSWAYWWALYYRGKKVYYATREVINNYLNKIK